MALKESARSLANDFGAAFGNRLRSVVLYGSVARGEQVEGLSNINVLLLLDEVDVEAIGKAGPLVRRWARDGHQPPLLMTWDEWERSADSFAIEVADMRDAREVLAGADPIASMQVDVRDLRLQAERELKEKLLLLRTRLLIASDKDAEVGRLLLASLPSFATYLRTILRIAGRGVPAQTGAVLQEAETLLGTPLAPLQQVLEARNNRQVLRVRFDDALVRGYYDAARRMEQFVDSFGETTTQ